MQICHHYKDDLLEWAVCRFDESFSELSAMCGDVSLVEYATEHFGSEKRRCEWLAARILVKKLVGSGVDVCYSPEGKPMLSDGSRFLSISHTACYVAVALHRNCSIGVDVEMFGTKVQKLYSRFLGASEIESLDKNNTLAAMLLHWSAKEALFKIVGNRGGSYAENFSLSPFIVTASGSFTISYVDDGVLKKKYPVIYFVEHDYVFTLCIDRQ